MVVRWLRKLMLIWCLFGVRLLRRSVFIGCCLFLGVWPLSCGKDTPNADPCRLDRCDPDGVISTMCSQIGDATITTTLDTSTKGSYQN